MKKLDQYELKINPEDGTLVDFISIVDKPAIERNFVAFNKEDISLQRFTKNEVKMELLGPALIPNEMIYRKSPSGYEYEVYFSKETIRNIAQTYMERGFQNNMDVNHTAVSANSFVYQFAIIGEGGFIAPKEFDYLNAPEFDGSLMVGTKVKSKDIFNKIINKELNGFSIAGLFEYVDSRMETDMQKMYSMIEKFNRLVDQRKIGFLK